jgi:hypothetical protein
VRPAQGTITLFDVPNSYFTEPVSIDDFGVIAGTTELIGYSGFLRVP